jgi:signal transduction histidine kinase
MASTVIDALLGLAVLAASMVRIGSDDTLVFSPPTAPVECLVFLAAAGAFAARRAPYAALGVATVLDALPYWLPIGGAGYHLGIMIAIYSVVAHRPARRALPVVGAVVVLQVSLMAWDLDWVWLSMYVVVAALSDLIPVALGMAARSRALAADALEQRALAAERSRDADARKLLAEDRLRTARNLHDSVAHQIAVMNLNAGVASQSLRARPDEAEAALVAVRKAGRGVICSISDLLTNLRDGQDNEPERHHDLADVRDLVDQFRQLSPDLTVSIDGHVPTDHTVGDALYPVVMEALTNAYKHGRHDVPAELSIVLDDRSSRVHMTNACAPTPSNAAGFGLTGMHERVAAVGGQLSVDPGPSVFTLDARVPHAGPDS